MLGLRILKWFCFLMLIISVEICKEIIYFKLFVRKHIYFVIFKENNKNVCLLRRVTSKIHPKTWVFYLGLQSCHYTVCTLFIKKISLRQILSNCCQQHTPGGAYQRRYIQSVCRCGWNVARHKTYSNFALRYQTFCTHIKCTTKG